MITHKKERKLILLEKYIIIGRKWIEQRFLNDTLQHHGIKGQKWGVRNGPPYPLKDGNKFNKTIKATITGHSGPSKQGIPNSVVDHISDSGKVKARAFYNAYGWKEKETHTNDHGNPKQHPYGENGEHIHYYSWNKETGKLENNKKADIPIQIREENGDIL